MENNYTQNLFTKYNSWFRRDDYRVYSVSWILCLSVFVLQNLLYIINVFSTDMGDTKREERARIKIAPQ
jgi:hypothetical protein